MMRLDFILQFLAGFISLLFVETLCNDVGDWSGLKLPSTQEIMEQLESANRLFIAEDRVQSIASNKKELRQLVENMKNLTIRVLARPRMPYLLFRGYTGQPNDSLKLTGFVGEIWNIMEENLGFKTEINLRAKNLSGAWDIALDPKEWFSNKIDRYEYTIPIAETWYLLFTKGGLQEQANSRFYFRVLSGDLWLVMIVGLIILSTYLWTVWRIREKLVKNLNNEKALEDTKYSTCLISVLGTFINQGSQFRDVTASPIRCITVACILVGYITANSYSALLISKLATAPRVNSEAIYLTDLLENPAGRTLCVLPTSVAYQMLMEASKNQTFKNIAIKFNQPPCSKADLGFVPLDDYCADGAVVLDSWYNLVNALLRKPNQYFGCPVLIQPMRYFISNLVLVVRKGFPYLRIINKQLQIMEESGVLKKMRDKWLPKLDAPSNKMGQPTNQPITVQFSHTRSIFYSYLIAVAISCALLGIEFIQNYQKERKKSTKIEGILKK